MNEINSFSLKDVAKSWMYGLVINSVAA